MLSVVNAKCCVSVNVNSVNGAAKSEKTCLERHVTTWDIRSGRLERKSVAEEARWRKSGGFGGALFGVGCSIHYIIQASSSLRHSKREKTSKKKAEAART